MINPERNSSFLFVLIVIGILSFFGIFLGFIQKSIIGIKLSFFCLFSSIFIIKTFILSSSIGLYRMASDKDRIEKIEEKVEDIHRDYFYGGKKRKEVSNFIVGILLGISLSLLVEGGLELISLNIDRDKQLDIFSNLSDSMRSNMSELEKTTMRFNYGVAWLHIGYIGIILFMAIVLLYISLSFYFWRNRDLFGNKLVFDYRIKTKLDTFEIIKIIDSEIKKSLDNKNIKSELRGRIDDKITLMVYHKYKRWLFESVNIIRVSENKIEIFYHTSSLGERVGDISHETIKKLEKKGSIELVRKERH